MPAAAAVGVRWVTSLRDAGGNCEYTEAIEVLAVRVRCRRHHTRCSQEKNATPREMPAARCSFLLQSRRPSHISRSLLPLPPSPSLSLPLPPSPTLPPPPPAPSYVPHSVLDISIFVATATSVYHPPPPPPPPSLSHSLPPLRFCSAAPSRLRCITLARPRS